MGDGVDLNILRINGWEVECESPFEIRHEDGSFATMSAAYSVLSELKYEASYPKFEYKKEFLNTDNLSVRNIEEYLNDMGDLGWELVQVTVKFFPSTKVSFGHEFYFKKQKLIK